MAKRKIKLRTRDIAQAPQQDNRAEQVISRIDDLRRDIASIPKPDLGAVQAEIDGLRQDVEKMVGEIPRPQEWKFDIRRSNGRIVEVNAIPIGEKAPGHQANVFNLYKESE